ncbi:MAG: hypothetical protein SOT76_04745 [Eubacteriales bacterium]|nr:hypothetical protein [bacterium]MDY2792031.1 hypothetical protein [Eubacteriales bacterium]
MNAAKTSGRRGTWVTALCVVLLSLGLWALLSVWTNTPFAGKSPYCTYTLQAMAWRDGRVSLGQDYPWLELAVYQGDWYVSFPPTPTVPIYLLTFLFGSNVPDNLLIKVYALVGMLAVFFALRKRQGNLRAGFIALMTGFCGSAAALATQGAVWYQAQMLAFCLTACAVCLASEGSITVSLFLYALSVGCRPFNVAYGPLLMLIWARRKRLHTTRELARGLWKGIVLGLCVAAAYAAYNYARFGDPLEFGTNYLPEFMRSAHGEFSLKHLANNLRNVVLGGPLERGENGWSIKKYGFSLFLANPLLICLVVRFVLDAAKRRLNSVKCLCMALFLAQMFLLLLHRTFGGFQFGARYAFDLVPYYVAYLCADERRLSAWEIALMLAGLAFSLYGVSVVHI